MQPKYSLSTRLSRALKKEITVLHLKLLLVNLVLLPLPLYMGSRLRAFLYRLIGFRIAGGAGIFGNLVVDAVGNCYPRLTVGERTTIGHSCLINLNAPVTIGDRVSISFCTKIITDTHELDPTDERIRRRFALPVTIEDGVWIGTGVTIMPGVTIGRGSVVGAASVVTKDVPPNTVVAGVPARFIKEIAVS